MRTIDELIESMNWPGFVFQHTGRRNTSILRSEGRIQQRRNDA